MEFENYKFIIYAYILFYFSEYELLFLCVTSLVVLWLYVDQIYLILIRQKWDGAVYIKDR